MENNGIDITERERVLLSEAEKLNAADVVVSEGKSEIKQLESKYKGLDIKVYKVTIPVTEDDDTETEFTYLFKRPKEQSYDRYVKTISNSATKASKAFVNDNIIDEQRDQLKKDLEEYPAMAINISQKLLAMLGLADSVYVKKL